MVSPFAVLIRLFQLLCSSNFYLSILTSIGRILLGFFSGLLIGILAAIAAAEFQWAEDLLKPFVFAVKSTPVASFIILILIWVKSSNLPQIISFLMVFPIIYENVLAGIRATDEKLLEMAEIFSVPKKIQIRTIYFSEVLPYLESGCSLALGLAWKSGIAAEVIGLPDHSIGEHLYDAKIYLNTPDLFAWTVVIILLSVLFEKIFMFLLHRLIGRMEREL